MVHVNNFASEITTWTNLFSEVIALGGGNISRGELFDKLYRISAEADSDVGALMGYNFLAGEPIAGVSAGAPLLMRAPEGRLTLPNFMKMQIYSALGTLAIGCEMLEKENVTIDSVCGHGGFFKTPVIGQSTMSAAVKAPVTVMKNAGEGGAFGIALLAMFAYSGEENLEAFLNGIYGDTEKTTVSADETEISSFAAFMEKYKRGIAVERLATEVI
jgi:sugar (pentulose or hexulose) kinase